MRIGVGRYMQNHSGHALEAPDHLVYDEEISLASLAEPLGFDSIWTTSHYFSPYQMTGSALQQATFMAGRTTRVDFGTMVVVLPWHHPLHVATEVCVLDNMLGGRRLILGLGRGAYRAEFDRFGVPMEEATARFEESVKIIRLALAREQFSYDGTFYRIGETSVRPRPRNPQQLLDDMRVVWNDGKGHPWPADLGLDVLMFASGPGSKHRAALDRLDARRAAKSCAPSRPVLSMLAACTSSDAEGRHLIGRHAAEFMASGERLARLAPKRPWSPRGALRRLAGIAGLGSGMDLQLWGSPSRCIDRLQELHRTVRPREVVVAFRFGAMPFATAEKSMRLFAEEVLPVVHSWTV